MEWMGEKFDKNNPERFNRTWICQQIRKDLKEAFKKDWKFSVRKDSSNGIDVTIRKAPKNELVEEFQDEHAYHYGLNAKAYLANNETFNKIARIVNAYNYDNSDSHVDYFDRNYYIHLEIELKGDF